MSRSRDRDKRGEVGAVAHPETEVPGYVYRLGAGQGLPIRVSGAGVPGSGERVRADEQSAGTCVAGSLGESGIPGEVGTSWSPSDAVPSIAIEGPLVSGVRSALSSSARHPGSEG